MQARERFGWRVALQSDDGRTTEREVWAYWSPDKEGTVEAVGATARAEAFMAAGKQREFFPLSVERIAA